MASEAERGLKITQKVIQTVGGQVAGVMKDYQDELNEAFVNAGNKKFDVGFKITFDAAQNDSVKVKSAISFVLEKVTDSAECTVSNQPELFEEPEQEELTGSSGTQLDFNINKLLSGNGWNLTALRPAIKAIQNPHPANHEWARNGQRRNKCRGNS
jgi:hypothetical protein